MKTPKEKVKQKYLFNFLFYFSEIIYSLVILRASLFKYTRPLELFDTERYRIRGVNLIPFNNSGLFFIEDIFINVALYMPFGFLIAIKTRNKRFLLLPFTASVFLECLQYILQLGTSDITDFINNSIGAYLGFAFYILLFKLFNNRLDKICIIIMTFVACIALVLMY